MRVEGGSFWMDYAWLYQDIRGMATAYYIFHLFIDARVQTVHIYV